MPQTGCRHRRGDRKDAARASLTRPRLFRAAIFLAGLYRAERTIAERLMRLQARTIRKEALCHVAVGQPAEAGVGPGPIIGRSLLSV